MPPPPTSFCVTGRVLYATDCQLIRSRNGQRNDECNCIDGRTGSHPHRPSAAIAILPMIDRLIHSATCLSRPPHFIESSGAAPVRLDGWTDGRTDGRCEQQQQYSSSSIIHREIAPAPAQRHLAENGKCEMRQEMAMCLWAATTHFSCAADAAAARKNSMGDMEGGQGGKEGGGAVLLCLEAKRRRRRTRR